MSSVTTCSDPNSRSRDNGCCVTNVTSGCATIVTNNTSYNSTAPGAAPMSTSHPSSHSQIADGCKSDHGNSTAPDDSEDGVRYMEMTFSAALEALADDEVPVGCVFVDSRDDRVIARGRNTVNATHNATRHAELNCIDDIHDSRPDWSRKDLDALWPHLDVYVTVEPCIMCAAALSLVGVRVVYYGCANQRFGGCGSVLDVTNQRLGGCDSVPDLTNQRLAEACSVLDTTNQRLAGGDSLPDLTNQRLDGCGSVPDTTNSTRFVHHVRYTERAIGLLKRFYCGENQNAPPEKRKRKDA